MGLLGTRRRRAAAGAMAGLCALGFAACFLLEDESPPDNADLILVRRFVPDGENGFLDIDFGKEALYWPSDAELRGGDEDPETDADPEERFAPEIVARNAEGLRKLEACLEPTFRIGG